MNKSKSIVKQAGILAIAGILVRIIGVLYRSPLTAMIGDEGNGYYSTAYNIYALVLMISSYSIPTAISKLISEKLALNQYNFAKKIFKVAMIYVAVIAGAAALVTFILAPFIVTKNAVFALRILCPTIFVSGLVGVLRGYFQAHSTTVYTSISQIIEQVFNACVSVGAAWLFIQPFKNGGDVHMMASRGAGGSALGTGAGVLAALIYIGLMYLMKHNRMTEETDPDNYEEDTKAIYKAILNIVTPIIIATCVYNLITTIDMYIYYGIMNMRHMDAIMQAKLYGVYAGKYFVLQNVPVALASAMSTAAIPSISGSYALKNLDDVRANITNAINVTMLILIPSAVGMGVLSYPIMGLLFPQPETLKLASMALTIGAPSIVFFGLSTLTNGILQGVGAVKVPLHNAVIALVVHVITLPIMLMLMPHPWLEQAVFILVISNALYALQISFANDASIKKLLQYKHARRTFVLPVIASTIMGAIVYLSYKGLFILSGHMVFLPLVLSIMIGVIVYFVVILYLYKDHLELLNSIPMMDKVTSRLMKKTADK